MPNCSRWLKKALSLIHILKDAASPGKWLLSELTRGYKGTTAASGASGAAVSLKSRAFVQALCRPNVSAWIAIDKTLQACLLYTSSGYLLLQVHLSLQLSFPKLFEMKAGRR